MCSDKIQESINRLDTLRMMIQQMSKLDPAFNTEPLKGFSESISKDLFDIAVDLEDALEE